MKTNKTRIKIDISQDSPVSSILFLIYIRNLFSNLKNMKIRSSSYLDDIELVVFSESIERNCLLLKNAAEKLFQLQASNMNQFDMKKTELIHFHSKRFIRSENHPVQIEDNLIKPKNLVR